MLTEGNQVYEVSRKWVAHSWCAINASSPLLSISFLWHSESKIPQNGFIGPTSWELCGTEFMVISHLARNVTICRCWLLMDGSEKPKLKCKEFILQISDWPEGIRGSSWHRQLLGNLEENMRSKMNTKRLERESRLVSVQDSLRTGHIHFCDPWKSLLILQCQNHQDLLFKVWK